MTRANDAGQFGGRAMLTHLSVKNYRSLEAVDIPLEPLTAIVGPNGAGKTGLLQSINIVLGEAWPTLRSFRVPQDFTKFDTSREIEIIVRFAPQFSHKDMMGKEHKVGAIRFRCKPYKRTGKWGEEGDLHAELEPLNEKDEVPNVAVTPPRTGDKAQFRLLTVGNELRDSARVLFVDHRRSIAQHLPSVRGSVLGRLLQPARKEFSKQTDFKRAYDEAMALLRTDAVQEIEETIADTAKRMLGFLGQRVTESVKIGFGFTDPANPFNSLRLQYEESGLIVPGEELGLGIQSAIVVGIFEAFRQHGAEVGTVVIEEPEMYLHPQAQRYFYRLLCKMVDEKQCQVIYSTHSPIFADVNRFEALRLIRRDLGKHSCATYLPKEEHASLSKARETLKIGGRFDAARNEVLFARQALLVEGYGDRNAAAIVAEGLKFDIDAEGVSIVDCGGKTGIDLVARVCRALSIPFIVLHDEDIWPVEPSDSAKQEAENLEAKQINERIQEAVGDLSKIFVVSPTLEAVLGIGRNASDKPLKVAKKLQEMKLGEMPQELVNAVKALKDATIAKPNVVADTGEAKTLRMF